MEFSKIVLVTSYVIGVLILIFAMTIQWLFMSNDYHGGSEIVVTLITGAFAEMGIVSSMYSWKSKAENIIKIQQQYGSEIADKVKDIDI